jgi:hypothetical protein
MILWLAVAAHAAPVSLTHSGRLVGPNGAPIEGPTQVTVRLWDAASGGAERWSRTFDLSVDDGFYSVVLEGGTPTLDSAHFETATWVEVSLPTATLSRQPLGVVPRAAHATSVSGGSVVVPTAAGSCTTPGSLARDSGTGALRVCQGTSYVDVASAAQIQGLIDQALGTAPASLGSRVKSVATRARAYGPVYDRDWAPTSGLIVPFTSRGGPIQVNLSIAMDGGSHSSCRSMIDGLPASLYTKFDTTYYWAEGLEYSADGWAMWDPPMLYEGIPAGQHVLTVDCHTDSGTTEVTLGNGRMTNIASVIAYEPVGTSAINAASDEGLPDVDVSTSYSVIPGISVPVTATGGPVRISWAVPLSGGSHSSCRPRLGNTVAGAFDGDTVGYIWSEGLAISSDQWNMHNRTRIYIGVPAGTYTATLECVTDGGTVNVGNSRMGPALSVTTYPTSGGGVSVVRAKKIGGQSVTANAVWTAVSGLSTSLTTTGGPVEIGVSIPLDGGSHAACRPTLNGNAIASPVDDFTYIWHDGLVRSNDGWAMWDRVRVYPNIAAGTYTLGVQCTADAPATLNMGVGTVNNGGTSTVWAIAYDP